MKKLIGFIFSLCLLGCASNEPFVKVTAQTIDSVVVLNVMNDNGFGIGGSGVVISPNGHILTCRHLFDYFEPVEIHVKFYSNRQVSGILLAKDPKRDLALIHVSTPTPNYASIARPGTLKVGQRILVIGHPYVFDFTVTHGIISALNRDWSDYNMLQTDAAMNPGNSGGPLFNMKGEVIGICSFVYSPLVFMSIHSGIGFAVEAGQIYEFIHRFKGLIQ